MFFVILDDSDQRHFRTCSCRGRYGNEGLQMPLQGSGAAEGHQVGCVFGNDDVDSFGRIHDRTAADGDNGVTGIVPVKTEPAD